MIIDIHIRAWSNLDQLGPEAAERLRARRVERWGQLDASPNARERSMSCVTVAVVHGYRSDRLGAGVPNEYIAEQCRKSSGRLIGVAGIDPLADRAMEDLHQAVDLGLVGVSISPMQQGFHPLHSSAMRIYEACAAEGLPVFVSPQEPLTAGAAMEFGRPSAWDEVARQFPSLPIVIGGLGFPWIDESLVLISKHSNVFAELSGVASRPWQLYNTLLSAWTMGVMDKLMFGSGFPMDTPAKVIEAMYSVNAYSHGTQLPSIPRAMIRAIVERNSLECLGIEIDGASLTGLSPEIDVLGEVQSASRVLNRADVWSGQFDDESDEA